MPTSLCWKGKAIGCGKVKSKSRHGARKHDRTGLHPSSSQRLSPTAQHAPPLQPLGPASGFQPLPTRLLSGVGPLRLTPGQRTPSGTQPGRTPSAPGAFSSLLPAGLGRNQVAAASSWLPRIPGSETPLGPAAACSPTDSPSANRRSLKKPRFLMRANMITGTRLRFGITRSIQLDRRGIGDMSRTFERRLHFSQLSGEILNRLIVAGGLSTFICELDVFLRTDREDIEYRKCCSQPDSPVGALKVQATCSTCETSVRIGAGASPVQGGFAVELRIVGAIKNFGAGVEFDDAQSLRFRQRVIRYRSCEEPHPAVDRQADHSRISIRASAIPRMS